MSAGALIISAKKGLLNEFAEELIKNNFDSQFSASIVISQVVNNDGGKFIDRIFIDDEEEMVVDEDGFEEFEIQEYRRLLDEESKPLLYYYCKYHSRSFIIDVLLAIASRSDVVIDDDDALIVRGDQLFKRVSEFK